MAEINAKDLTAKTSPASTDSMLLFGTTSNEGAKITVDNLADNILSRLTTKTFANQVGGSSAATILAQLATLNSNIDVQNLVPSNFRFVMTASNTWEDTGITFTLTKEAVVYVRITWVAVRPSGLIISTNTTTNNGILYSEASTVGSQTVCGILSARTYYIFAKGGTSANAHGLEIKVIGDPGASVSYPS